MSKRITTYDHEEIKDWVEKREGTPVLVKVEKSEGVVTNLSVDFEKPIEKDVLKKEPISWDTFFEIFESKMLAFQYEVGEDKEIDCKIVGRNL